MKKKVATLMTATATLGILALGSTAIASSLGGTGGGSGGDVSRVRIEARMESGNDQSQARARYQERQRGNLLMQRFDVDAEDFEPGTVLDVTVLGRFVGTITIDDLGAGELQLRTGAFIDDPGDGTPIDPDFPRLMLGDSVTVGPLSGSFGSR